MTGTSHEVGCALKPAIAPKPKTISVNGVVISRAAIARETQHHPASKPIEAWLSAARALVVRQLLLREARRLALEPAPMTDEEGRRETDEEALVRQLVEREVVTPRADEATCRRYHAQNRGRFMSAPLHEVAHILLAIRRDDPDGTRAREKACALIDALTREPEAFGMLAKLHSACPSKQVGGNLGQIGPGQTAPEFEAALAKAPLGEIAPEPVRSRYGFHVVKVFRRIEAREIPFEVVAERIAAFLDDRVRRTAIQQYVALLAGQADIVGINVATSRSPLVQ